jgi:hypothetical protein
MQRIIITNGISTWKRPGGSAANPPEAIGNIVHRFALRQGRFHVEMSPKHSQELLASAPLLRPFLRITLASPGGCGIRKTLFAAAR